MPEIIENFSYETCYDSYIKDTFVTDIMRAEQVEWVTYDQVSPSASYCTGPVYSSPSDTFLVSLDCVGDWW